MVKHIALVTEKPGYGRDAFIDRYENGHALLAIRILPPGTYTDYRRNYVVPGSMISMAHVGAAAPAPDFIDISEFWYPDQQAVDRLMQALAETDAGQQIIDDEAAFMDRSRITMIEAEEYVTPADKLAPRPAAHQGQPAVKIFALVKKKDGLSRADFIDYYEKRHAPFALEQFRKADGHPHFAQYRRNFPVPGDLFKLPHVEYVQPPLGFDVMTEIWFWTEADYQAFVAKSGEPELAAVMAADEENLFDRSSITMFHVDEYVTPRENLEKMGWDSTLAAKA